MGHWWLMKHGQVCSEGFGDIQCVLYNTPLEKAVRPLSDLFIVVVLC